MVLKSVTGVIYFQSSLAQEKGNENNNNKNPLAHLMGSSTRKTEQSINKFVVI